jgi:hypothetical protein
MPTALAKTTLLVCASLSVLLLAISFNVFPFERQGRTFYVSPSGSNGNVGTDPAHAWQNCDKVTAYKFIRYDRVLFEGGQTFSCGVTLTAINSPGLLTIGRYGSGNATLSSGNSAPCLSFTNISAITVSAGIVCNGGGATTSTTPGVLVLNTGSAQIAGPTLVNLIVSGYGQSCIAVRASGDFGFKNITISNPITHDCTGKAGNLTAGVEVSANSRLKTAHANLTIANPISYNNAGYANPRDWAGSGIFVNCVTGAHLFGFLVHDNGAKNKSSSSGPVGVITSFSDEVLIEQGEIYNQKSANGIDGEGFDLDMGTSNSIAQQIYTHDNQSIGLLVFQSSDAGTHANNQIRLSVSQNDAGGCFGVGPLSGTMIAEYFIRDTCYETVANAAAVTELVTGGTVAAVFADNIFYVSGSSNAKYMKVGDKLVFTGNDYFGNATYEYAGTDYSTFSRWQTATGQEKVGGVNVGQTVDPQLAASGSGRTLGDCIPASLADYQLQETSPMIDAGIDVASVYGIDVGTQDFYGEPVQNANGHFNIGAGGLKSTRK